MSSDQGLGVGAVCVRGDHDEVPVTARRGVSVDHGGGDLRVAMAIYDRGCQGSASTEGAEAGTSGEGVSQPGTQSPEREQKHVKSISLVT